MSIKDRYSHTFSFVVFILDKRVLMTSSFFDCMGREKDTSPFMKMRDIEWSESVRANERRSAEYWLKSDNAVVTTFLETLDDVILESRDIQKLSSDTIKECGYVTRPQVKLRVLCMSHDNENQPEEITLNNDIYRSSTGRSLTVQIVNSLEMIKDNIDFFTEDLNRSNAFALYRPKKTGEEHVEFEQNITESNDYINILPHRIEEGSYVYYALFTYDVSKPVVETDKNCIIL